MKFNIVTLGCKVNQYESQAMREDLIKNGFESCKEGEQADVIIINSCTVTSVSDSKNRRVINKSRRENPNAVIVLTGCMPQAFPSREEDFKNCDIVLGNAKRAELVPAINEYFSTKEKYVHISKHKKSGEEFENLTVSSLGGHTRAFIKIEDGCNRFCSYCVIPYARGRVRSKPLDVLSREIEKVAHNGYKEVVLVGINLSAYGLNEGFDLADAVERACKVDGIERVRLGSIEPEQMDEKLIKRLAAQKKFCPQFHLSLQSGCDNTLKTMNRHYTSAEYAEIVENLRGVFDNCAITTDIMVGFAGESEEDFQASMRFAREIGFAKIHVFPYSVRKGTAAEKLCGHIPAAEKERRARLMGETAEKLRAEFLKSQVGLTEKVLVERARHDYLEGYTANYIPVHIAKGSKDLCGRIVDVKLTRAFDDYCEGKIIL